MYHSQKSKVEFCVKQPARQNPTYFKCKAIETNDGGCNLKDADRYDAPIAAADGRAFHEIVCWDAQDCPDGVWNGPVRDMSIQGNDIVTVTVSLEECQKSCKNEIHFKCRSVDYNIHTRQCHM
ncbi:hypothetical protein CAPTEDRAFT_211449 [Capitella teleta]|uniref:Apple domain-containing protein n=1 Tax=Capitella teleta TaxID=283909 RepID=R7TW72_CAPTE|nr:hypothetical protein CAPTEDRAFT_211449 [Capitella teleta]|eukprot:ELT97984.1 hypothetical protein CAPTEDRAFT_211449 [Capitella teleta]